jgi:hypothetical protein
MHRADKAQFFFASFLFFSVERRQWMNLLSLPWVDVMCTWCARAHHKGARSLLRLATPGPCLRACVFGPASLIFVLRLVFKRCLAEDKRCWHRLKGRKARVDPPLIKKRSGGHGTSLGMYCHIYLCYTSPQRWQTAAAHMLLNMSSMDNSTR